MADYYDTLGVPRNASKDDVITALEEIIRELKKAK